MNCIKNWIKTKLYNLLEISKIRNRINDNKIEIQKMQKIIKERTEYHLDIHQTRDSQVIIIGKYRKADFVKCYSIPAKSIIEVIEHCKSLEQYTNRGKFDTYPSISSYINNELVKSGY